MQCHSNCNIKKSTASIFWLSHPLSNHMLRLEMKMPLFLQAAPGMSLGEEFDAPYKHLELSSAVKVKTHQFSSKFHHVLDSSVRESGRESATERAYRIRPLGVTVLSRMRPAPSHKHMHSHTRTKWCHVGASIVQERWFGFQSVVATQRGSCAPLSSLLQGRMINGRSNNFGVVHKIKFLPETSIRSLTLPSSFAASSEQI